jgi:hypothetical protein
MKWKLNRIRQLLQSNSLLIYEELDYYACFEGSACYSGYRLHEVVGVIHNRQYSTISNRQDICIRDLIIQTIVQAIGCDSSWTYATFQVSCLLYLLKSSFLHREIPKPYHVQLRQIQYCLHSGSQD